MNDKRSQQIVPGLFLTELGQANIDASLTDVLFDLAVQLEGPTNLPVDVEHVVAALVLAVRAGDLDSQTPLSAEEPAVVLALVEHVKAIFQRFGDSVGGEDA